MPVLVAITIAALAGGGFLFAAEPVDVDANPDAATKFEAKIANLSSLLKTNSEVDLHFKAKNPEGVKSAISTTVTSTKATSTKATSTKAEAAIEGRIGAVENFIASVRHFIEVKKDEVSAALVADAEAKLKAAENLLVEARAKLEADANKDARRLTKQAMEQAKEAKATIKAGVVEGDDEGKINLELRDCRFSSASDAKSHFIPLMSELGIKNSTHLICLLK